MRQERNDGKCYSHRYQPQRCRIVTQLYVGVDSEGKRLRPAGDVAGDDDGGTELAESSDKAQQDPRQDATIRERDRDR